MRNLLQEIKRRNVFKVAIVYVIASWLTMQVVDVMFPALKLPEWLTTAIAALLLIGFPFAIIFAWAFEMTPEGIKREKDVDRGESVTHETGQKLNRGALIVLTVALGFLLVDKFVLRSGSGSPPPNDIAAEVTQTVKPSIAVLPFVNMSDDAENEYFSDGLSEELLNVLAKIPQLHVAGRTSSFAFKGQNQDLRSIGEQLNVANILEGSVRKSNTRLRITAQLIDAENGYHLWSDTYDREVTDVFAVQDEISAAVVDALKVALLGEEIQTDYGTDNLDAYNLFLKARYLFEHTTADNLQVAITTLDEAIALDPGYTDALMLRTSAEYQHVAGFAAGGENFETGVERVRQFAQKAIESAPESADAHFVRGLIATTVDWTFHAAEEHYARALEMDPAHLPARAWHGWALSVLDQTAEAVAEFKAVNRVDPLSINALRDLGDGYTFARDYERAIETYESILTLNDDVVRVHGRIARVHLFRGDAESASQRAGLEPVAWVRGLLEIIVLHRQGHDDEWQRAVDAYSEEYGDNNSYQLAEIYSDAGDYDSAFHWLEVARRVRDPGIVIARIDPFLDPLHDDPRWSGLLKSIGLAE